MVCSESVQYFQFNAEGNLFVYEPGAGFSGNCVRVEPGFEMHDVSQIRASLGECDGLNQLPMSATTSQVMTLSSEIVDASSDTK